MVADNTHSQLVSGAKVILPVIALVTLSTLFLLARTVDPDHAIPFADVNVSERARDQQMTQPKFSGVSSDGTEFTLRATRARPDLEDPRRMLAENVDLALRAADGGLASVSAATGDVDTGRRRLVLEGDVRVETSTGFMLMTPRLEGNLGRLNIAARGGVEGTGPLGTLTASAMTLTEGENGTQRLLFTGDVNLLYTPPDN